MFLPPIFKDLVKLRTEGVNLVSESLIQHVYYQNGTQVVHFIYFSDKFYAWNILLPYNSSRLNIRSGRVLVLVSSRNGCKIRIIILCQSISI